MQITRRKFFFFGLAAGIGLMLPKVDVRVSKKELWELYGGAAGGDKSLIMHPSQRDAYFSLLGIPYHENNATTGTWLGLSRSQESFWKGTR